MDLMDKATESRESPATELLRGQRPKLAGIGVTSLISGTSEALFLVVITRTAFAITDGNDQVGVFAANYVSVPVALLLALVLVAARMVSALLSTWQSVQLSSQAVADLRCRVSAAFLGASWEVQQDQPEGSLQQFLLAYSGNANGFLGGVGQVVITSMSLVAMLAIAIIVDPVGAAVLVAAVVVFAMLLRPLRAAVRRRSREATEASMEFAISVNEVSQLGLELHVFQVQEQAKEGVVDLIELNRVTEVRHAFTAGLTGPLYTGLAYVALLAGLAAVAATPSANLAELGAVMLIMLRSLGYGQALQISYMRMVSSIPPLEDLYARLEIFDDGRRFDGGEAVGTIGALELRNLSFSYFPGSPVLRNISFVVRPREIVGIVGPSGSGKSTLVELLLGLRDPDEGVILADGRDTRNFSRDEWARHITFVPQQAHLITGSIADNIRFLRDGVSDDDVEQAARLAHLHDDVAMFSEGYGRQLGGAGSRLSGGQQQRLCIARALVETPDILILDEPTSALDVRSEHLIRTTLKDLKDRMTVIVIAHRLSTLDMCDRIMVIQDGELRGFDTPRELENSSDFYREALHLSGLR